MRGVNIALSIILILIIIYSLFHNTKKIIWELDLWPDTLRDINLLKSKKLYSIIEKFVIKTYSFYDKKELFLSQQIPN